MFRSLFGFCVAGLIAASAALCQGSADGFVTVRAENFVAPDGSPLLLRGINLGNWLVPEGYMFKFEGASSPRQINEVLSELVGPDEAAAFWRDFRDSYITRDDIRFIKGLGLNSVRVPFNYRLLTPEDQPGTWLETGFVLLDRVIGWCKDEGLWVILDMHCAPGGQTGDNIDDSWGYPWLMESPESQARTALVWRTIAERYRREPAVLGYDLLNEPIATYFDSVALNPRLEPLYKTIVAAIREVDTRHIILLGGAQWDTNFEPFGEPFDPVLAYTFHKYWTDTTRAVIQAYVNFRAAHHVPVWMGESGENKDEWIDSFRRLLEQENIGWCFWPYKKMDAGTCLVTFDRPAGYEQIVKFANASRRTFGEIRAARPPLAAARKALEGFLRNCRFDRCRVNDGYVRALGLSGRLR
jgi:endoglucanase